MKSAVMANHDIHLTKNPLMPLTPSAWSILKIPDTIILPLFSVVRLLGTIRAVIAKEIQLCKSPPSMRRKATFYPVAGLLAGKER
jgi:hypothetical protein